MDYTLHPTISQDERGVLKAYVKFLLKMPITFKADLPGTSQKHS